MIVRAVDSTPIAVHDLGGAGRILLFSHATGFHGRCYTPVARRLAGRHCLALDYRGHGDTPRPEGPVDWVHYGDDALAVGSRLAGQQTGQPTGEQTGQPAGQHGGPIDAFGHSMGGAALLMAAHRRPQLFRRLVLFEPIVFPPEARDPNRDNSLARSTLRRRESFASYDDAIANFASKAPLAAFHPEALEYYVRHGFREAADGTVHLKCARETESETFATGTAHDTWDLLPQINTEVVVVNGRVDDAQPSMIAEAVAGRLPNARYLQRNDFDHFAPMTHPAEMAELLTELLTGLLTDLPH
jgi:pimeloyl-ACP methyl ester carboxylesterase